jgi:hypothetical protein
MRATTQKTIALVVTALGIAVVTYGVIVEDEPTAIGLALSLGGLVWFFIARARSRRGER